MTGEYLKTQEMYFSALILNFFMARAWHWLSVQRGRVLTSFCKLGYFLNLSAKVEQAVSGNGKILVDYELDFLLSFFLSFFFHLF